MWMNNDNATAERTDTWAIQSNAPRTSTLKDEEAERCASWASRRSKTFRRIERRSPLERGFVSARLTQAECCTVPKRIAEHWRRASRTSHGLTGTVVSSLTRRAGVAEKPG